jgi:hypothetical protein
VRIIAAGDLLSGTQHRPSMLIVGPFAPDPDLVSEVDAKNDGA